MLEVLVEQVGSASGPVLIALLVASLAATAVTIFKIIQFRQMGVGRLRGVMIQISGDRERALVEIGREVSPVSATVLAAMTSLKRYPENRQRAQEIAALTAVEQLTAMSRHLRLLEAVVQAAPMLGLLGTVVGMISAFGELSRNSGAIDPSALATGIWAALLTTAAGLAIAIPFYFIWVWLESRVEDERAAMEAAIGTVLFGEAGADPPQRAVPLDTAEPGAVRPARV